MAINRTIWTIAAIGLAISLGSEARAEPVQVYAAGSLRGVVTAIAARAAKMGIEVRPVFGGSGALRVVQTIIVDGPLRRGSSVRRKERG
jgi:ABC-type molybdate transport system substrate-binding protein